MTLSLRILVGLLLAGCFESAVPLDRPPADLVRGDPPAVEMLEPVVETRDDGCWQVETIAAHGADATIAIGPDGVTHVLFPTEDLGNPNPARALMHGTRGAAGWTLGLVDDRQASRPHAAVSADGLVHVAYNAPSGVHHAVLRAGAWESEPVTDPRIHGGDYPLALDATGAPLVAYFEVEVIGPTLYLATAEAGGWNARAVAEEAHDFRSSIAVAPDSAVHLAFTRAANGRGLTHVSNETGAWVAEPIASFSGNSSGLAVDDASVLHIAQDTDDERLVVETRTQGRWTAAILVGAGARSPAIALRSGEEQIGYVLTSVARVTGPGYGAIRLLQRVGDRWIDALIDDGVLGDTTVAVAVGPDDVVHVAYALGSTVAADGSSEAGEVRHAWRDCDQP